MVFLRGKATYREEGGGGRVFEEAEHQEVRIHRAQWNELGGEGEGEEGNEARA